MIMPETLTLEQVELLRASMPTTTQTIDDMVKEAKEAKDKDDTEEEKMVIPFLPK